MSHPETRRSDQPSRLRGGALTSLRLIVFGLVLSVVVAVNAGQALSSARLLAFGVSVSGTVIQKQTRGGGSSTHYQLKYSFPLDGRQVTGSCSLSKSDYNQLSSDGPVPIVYLPGSPQVNSYEGRLWSRLLSRLLTTALLGAVALVVLAVLFLGSRSRSSQDPVGRTEDLPSRPVPRHR